MPVAKKKLLLMGRSGSGKTSMRSIIFANYLARDTHRLGATSMAIPTNALLTRPVDVEHSQVLLFGSLALNIWDCGGQEAFMDSYLASQREHVFQNVAVLLYVFDVESSAYENDLCYYESCLEALGQYSSEARIFKEKEIDIKKRSLPMLANCFTTSIWDETLYKAWSSIFCNLVPNVRALEAMLDRFADSCEADEVVLFERTTFLVIAQVVQKPHVDAHRFEKISNIIKQFKFSCSQSQGQFQKLELSGNKFALVIDSLTSNSLIMVVISAVDRSMLPTMILGIKHVFLANLAVQVNIKYARAAFETLEAESALLP